jgi:hypothetical protein
MAGFVNTKATGWMLVPLWLLAVFLRSRNQPGSARAWLRDLAIGYGVLALLGTWWYVRNYQLYGQAIPIPLEYMGQSLRPFDLRTREPLLPVEVYTTGNVIPWGWRAVVGLFQSYWAQIDWVPEYLRADPAVSEFDLAPWNWGIAFSILLFLVLISAFGWVLLVLPGARAAIALWRAKEKPAKPPGWSAMWLMPAAFFAIWVSTWYTATFLHIGFYQGGRYLMPVSFAGGALLGLGWSRICPAWLRIPAALLLIALFLAFNGLCLYELISVLNPKYVL